MKILKHWALLVALEIGHPACLPPLLTGGLPAMGKAKVQKRQRFLFRCPNAGAEQGSRTSSGWRNKINNIKVQQITQGQIQNGIEEMFPLA